jgi:hypothetical protein
MQVQRAIQSLDNPNKDPRPGGRPRILSDDEDSALVAFVDYLQRGGFPATKPQIITVATGLRQLRDPDAEPISDGWYRNWLADHPELQSSYIKAIDRARKSFQSTDIEDIETFFKKLQRAIKRYRIGPSEIWNEDECGIRIGCIRERVHVIVTRTSRKQRPEVLDPANRESCTLLGAVNAIGDSMPPWLVFKTFPVESWASIKADEDIRFARSETGFSNAEITIDWLRHFNITSWEKSAQAQRSGLTLEEWFGCSPFDNGDDDDGDDSDGDDSDGDDGNATRKRKGRKVPRPSDQRIYRILVIDGFTGHTGLDFVAYCMRFDIIIVIFPPHSTHILQPLDVGVFQALKNAHQKALQRLLQQGDLHVSRLDFLKAFQDVFNEGFTAHNIMSGFEKTGIFPPTSTPAINRILNAQRKLREAINPAYASLLPDEFRFQGVADQIDDLIERYRDRHSSPSREVLRRAKRLVVEGTVMDSNLRENIRDRHSRIEKANNIMKRGKVVKPTGKFYTESVALKEIRIQHHKTLKEAEEKSHKAELKAIAKWMDDNMAQLKADWRSDKTNGVTDDEGKSFHRFRHWLSYTKRDQEYISLETQREEYKKLLNEPKTPSFYIDVSRPSLNKAIADASRTSRPLQEVEWPSSEYRSDITTRSIEVITHRDHTPEREKDELDYSSDPAPIDDDNDTFEDAVEAIDWTLRPSPPSSPPLSPRDSINEE